MVIWNWICKNVTYTNIRNIAELFYFIVLTGAMVYYAKKTYKKSVEEKPQLFVDVYVDYKDRLERGQICYPLYLEVYNNGSGAASNIKLSTSNSKLSESFSIFDTDIGFLQPKESKYIPIGSLIMPLTTNYLSVFDDLLKNDELNGTEFFIAYSGKKPEKLSLNFEYVLRMPHTPIGKTSEESAEEKQLKQIATSIEDVKKSVDVFAKKFK